MIPIKTMSSNDFAKAKLFHKEIYQILKKRILVWQQNNPECNGMRVIIDSHYNIQIHFSGKFFIDSTEIKFDIIPFYKWFLEIDNMIKFYWSTLYKFETNNIPLASVSRLDIATQKKDTFLNGYTSFPEKMILYKNLKFLLKMKDTLLALLLAQNKAVLLEIFFLEPMINDLKNLVISIVYNGSKQ